MTYEDWLNLSISERDRLWQKSVESINKLSRKIEKEVYFINEGLDKLRLEVEEWRTWQKLHLK